MSILEKYVAVGYGKHEAPMLVGAALHFNTLMLGRHGVCKSVGWEIVGRAIASLDGIDDSGYRYFSCDKVNMVTLAGLPNAAAMQRGEFGFAPNNASVFGDAVRVIMFDEVTRAKSDTQNQLMEILERRTCHGIPLNKGVSIVASANPISYKGTQDLDEAFFDRFMIVFETDSMLNEATDSDVRRALVMNRERSTHMPTIVQEIASLIRDVRQNFRDLQQDPDIVERVDNFIGAFWSRLSRRLPERAGLQGQKEILYISPRNIVKQLHDTIYGFAAYYKAKGVANFLVSGVDDALKYNLEYKFNHDGLNRAIQSVLRSTRFILESNVSSAEGKLRLSWAGIRRFPDYIKFMSENIDQVCDLFDLTELTQMVGTITEEARNSNNRAGLVALNSIVSDKPQFGHISHKLQSEIVFATLDKWIEQKRIKGPDITKPTFMTWDDVKEYLEEDLEAKSLKF